MLKRAKRIVVFVIGVTVILLGVVMLVLPGPGTLGIVAGLAILATEFVWARRFLRRAKRKLGGMLNQTGRAKTGTRPVGQDPSPQGCPLPHHREDSSP